MSAKQDRTAARTPADLERKYNFEQSFAEIMGIATDARTTAEAAKTTAENATKLTSEEVFNLLTEGGNLQGIYRGDDEDIYINASYIKSGIIDAAVVQVINLIAEIVKSVSGDGYVVGIRDGGIFGGSSSTNHTFSLSKASGEDYWVLSLGTELSDGTRVSGDLKWNELTLGSIDQDNPAFGVYGERDSALQPGVVKIRLPTTDGHNESLFAYWHNNGDGTFSIVGYREEPTI